MRTPGAVEHCPSCSVLLNGSLAGVFLVRIYSLAPDSTRALTSRILDCLSFLLSGMTSLTKIIGLKWAFSSFLLDLVFLPCLLVGVCRVFNMWASCNDLSKLLELSLCSLNLYLLLVFWFIYDKCISATAKSIVVLVASGTAADFVIFSRIWVIGNWCFPSFGRWVVRLASGWGFDIQRVRYIESFLLKSIPLGEIFV